MVKNNVHNTRSTKNDNITTYQNVTSHLDGAEPVYRCTRVPQPNKMYKKKT